MCSTSMSKKRCVGVGGKIRSPLTQYTLLKNGDIDAKVCGQSGSLGSAPVQHGFCSERYFTLQSTKGFLNNPDVDNP